VFGTAAGAPSCYWFTGGVDAVRYAEAELAGRVDEEIASNHSPLYAPVIEPTLTTGVRAMVAAARAWLGPD
jgi:hippurate hydrolase